ncbi:MAG: sensor histidine kinase, partial [Gallionellaceae bacterium]|nr:sensor histidine kinase [Gallionellaceae bacterium]
AASRHLVAAQEDARRRFSSELHDRTSPNLAAISINLNVISSILPQTLSADLAERMEDTLALIADTNASIREICADMRPPLLDYAGLAAALDSCAQQFARRTGVAAQFDCINYDTKRETELESLLFRIAQEALTNCAKHAQACFVHVTLSDENDLVTLTITDDGIGFDPMLLGKAGLIGLGVINMREMAEVAGGRFALESSPGKGTRIVVEVSL